MLEWGWGEQRGQHTWIQLHGDRRRDVRAARNSCQDNAPPEVFTAAVRVGYDIEQFYGNLSDFIDISWKSYEFNRFLYEIY